MKHITIALLLCAAIPAAAFAQTVSCEDCTHYVSVYVGEGGLVATADGADKVTYVATCGGVTRSGELEADTERMVAALLTTDNGLACDSNDASFQLGPIADGGWFWITDDTNSAVGNLVAADILKNATTGITSAGTSVTMTSGKGAVYLKETASGRVGILPNILPEPPTAPLRKCGFSGSATAQSPAKPVNTECLLGDGGTTVLMTSTNPITGRTVRIHDKGSVTRPAGTGSVVLVVDFWGNGTGHFVTAHSTDSNGISAMRGQLSVALGSTSSRRAAARLNGFVFLLQLVPDGPGSRRQVPDGDDDGLAGVSWSGDGSGQATITIKAEPSYCSMTANHPATFELTVIPTALASLAQVTPNLVLTESGSVDSASFTVRCPGTAA